MTKKVVIHQPDFLPYLGFFHRLLQADEFIVLEHVQMSKRGWVHRDKIKTSKGEEWITIPVKKIGDQPLINHAEVEYNPSYDKILRVIKVNYSQTPYFSSIFPELSAIFNIKPPRLMDLNMKFLELLMRYFGIQTHITFSDSSGITSRRSQMNADLAQAAGGTVYLSGMGAKDYHEDGPFYEKGISVEWQNFKHPVYPQQYGDFIPYLSSIDILFNCGIDKSREILRNCL